MKNNIDQKKILIAPEMVDLAEAHRMSSFANAFLSLGHEVIVLGNGRYDYLFSDERLKRVYIDFDDEWMNDEKFRMMHNLDEFGFEFISEDDLEKFVHLEVKLMQKLKPDVVITGFRPTMSISTKAAKVPLVWVLSAVCSDMYFQKGLVKPFMGMYKNAPFLKIIPDKIISSLFCKAAFIVPHKINAWNNVARKFNINEFKSPLQILRGDFNIMSDASELFLEFGELPPYYSFCGPLLFDSKIETPESVKNYKKKEGRPLVFFSMGSSGDPDIFKSIVAGFYGRPFDVFAASTNIINKEDIPFIPSNVIVERMFPAFDITNIADAAVIHGGQGTVYTTIMAGSPFVGIPMFSEQQSNLENFERKGCGIVLSRYNLTSKKLNTAITKILNNTHYKDQVMNVQKQIIKYKIDKNITPAMIGAKDVIRFLEKPQNSYFKLK